MKNILSLTIILASLIIVGCTANDSGNQDVNYDPIHFETNDDQGHIQDSPEVDHKYYKQSQRRMEEFEEGNSEQTDTDIYTNEETDRVVEHLKGQGNIIDAQVASTEDRIIVAVKLSEHVNHNVSHEIEEEVRTIVQDKEIVVYTDYTFWEEAEDQRASRGAAAIGKGVEDFLNNFFNVEMRD